MITHNSCLPYINIMIQNFEGVTMDAHDYKSVFYSVKCLIPFVINNQYSNKQTYMHTLLSVSMEQSEMRLGQI